jgi:peptidyl-prolyl cis-trans isomerase B (cyclophilin B)
MVDRKRRDASRRQLERQLAERQAQAAARRRRTMIMSAISAAVVVVIIVVVIVLASGGPSKKPAAAASSTPSTTAATSPSAAPATTDAAGNVNCVFTAAGSASRKVSLPASAAPTKGTVTVHVASTQGAMTFTLNRSAAPCTVASFVSLAKQKYFDNTPCHRVTTSDPYILQCGDPTGTGGGGPGYTIPDEYNGTETYTTGVLAMANVSGTPDSGGSQFFIVYKDSPLPATYTVFGKVTAGMSVVDKVAAKGSDNSNGTGDGKPILPISLTTVTVS